MNIEQAKKLILESERFGLSKALLHLGPIHKSRSNFIETSLGPLEIVSCVPVGDRLYHCITIVPLELLKQAVAEHELQTSNRNRKTSKSDKPKRARALGRKGKRKSRV